MMKDMTLEIVSCLEVMCSYMHKKKKEEKIGMAKLEELSGSRS